MTSFKKISIIAILMVSILITGCEKSAFCVQGEGTVTTEVLSISSFSGINSSFSNNVVIKQGAVLEVKATGHPNIIEKITTSVSNNIWEIDLDNACYQNYELSIEITIPNISSVGSSGSGDVTVEDFIDQGNLDIDMSGSGNITLNNFEGTTDLDVEISGSGDLIANNNITTLNSLDLNTSGSGDYSGFVISSSECTIKSSGSGDCEVNVTNTLDVDMSGSGDVSYRGTPTITREITGSGSLNDVN
jgi:hypothetical protein